MSISNKQKVAIAAIIAAGLLSAGAILWRDNSGGAPESHAEEAAGHAHEEGEKEGAKPGEGGHAHQEEGQGKEEAHGKASAGHEKEEGHAHKEGEEDAHGNAQAPHAEEEKDGHGHEDEKVAAGAKEDQKASGSPQAAAGAADKKIHSEGEKGHSEEKGTLKLSAEQLRQAGIDTATASPAALQRTFKFPGEIRFDEDRTAHVVPVVAGVAQSVPVQLGEFVKKGQLLAVISSAGLSEQRSELLAAQQRRALASQNYEREKKLWEDRISAQQDMQAAQAALREADIAVRNASQRLQSVGVGAGTGGALNRYELRAPQDGVIVEKHLSLGEAVKEDTTVFTLSDMRRVWAEFNVSAQDLGRVRPGQKAEVSSTAFDEKAPGEVAYIGALLGEQSRTAKARVRLENPRMAWRPGLFVSVELQQDPAAAAVTVPVSAVQTQGEESVVFLLLPGNTVKAQPVRLGRSDGRNVEVLDGLAPGAQLASGNTFVIKSELGKSSATHSH